MRSLKNTALRRAAVLAILGGALAFMPVAEARVQVGFHVGIALPPGVHVNVSNYEPYYVGRVYYEPYRVWRSVYSFPVETPYGIVYQPYIYEGNQVVFHDYIPGPEFGYVRFVREGRGHYDPRWRHDRYARMDRSHDDRYHNDRHPRHRDHEREYYGEW